MQCFYSTLRRRFTQSLERSRLVAFAYVSIKLSSVDVLSFLITMFALFVLYSFLFLLLLTFYLMLVNAIFCVFLE